jgi:hypothetical protein
VGLLVSLAPMAAVAAIPTVEECLQQLKREPRSRAPYSCLTMSNDPARRARVLRALETLKRQRPTDGRPVFWSALIRENAGVPVPEREFEEAAEKFAAEGHVPGQVSALVALSSRSFSARLRAHSVTGPRGQASEHNEGHGDPNRHRAVPSPVAEGDRPRLFSPHASGRVGRPALSGQA